MITSRRCSDLPDFFGPICPGKRRSSLQSHSRSGPKRPVPSAGHSTGGELDGLQADGFAIWRRRDGNGRNVTFSARQFTVHGERRSFSLLRPIMDPNVQDRIRDAVLRAYMEQEHEVSEASAS